MIKVLLNMLVVLTLILSCLVLTAQAQETEQYVISAKAGRVNMVSGSVTHQQKDKAEWQSLAAKKNLNSGDVVKTGADGRMEMLLNPGSYLRVAENSQVKLIDNSIENLRFSIVKGSAIIEATGTDGTRLLAEVSTPQTKVVVDRNGLYRINVLPTGTTEVFVSKGRVLIGNDLKTKVGGGKKITIGSGGTEVAKFDKKNQDVFDQWSKQRAEVLIAANRKLSRQTIVSALAGFRRSGAYGYGYAPYFGLWIYDAFLDCYTFFPFYGGWSSPYGRSYARSFGLPWYFYRPDSSYVQIPGGGTPGGGIGGGGTVGSNPMPLPTAPVEGSPGRPPFRKGDPVDPIDPDQRRHSRPFPTTAGESTDRFDRDFGGGRRDSGDRGFDNHDRFGGRPHSEPVYQPSPSYTPPPSPPPPPPSSPVERPEPMHRKSDPREP